MMARFGKSRLADWLDGGKFADYPVRLVAIARSSQVSADSFDSEDTPAPTIQHRRSRPHNVIQTRSRDAYDKDDNTVSPYDSDEKHVTFDFGVSKGLHGYWNPDEWEEQYH